MGAMGNLKKAADRTRLSGDRFAYGKNRFELGTSIEEQIEGLGYLAQAACYEELTHQVGDATLYLREHSERIHKLAESTQGGVALMPPSSERFNFERKAYVLARLADYFGRSEKTIALIKPITQPDPVAEVRLKIAIQSMSSVSSAEEQAKVLRLAVDSAEQTLFIKAGHLLEKAYLESLKTDQPQPRLAYEAYRFYQEYLPLNDAIGRQYELASRYGFKIYQNASLTGPEKRFFIQSLLEKNKQLEEPGVLQAFTQVIQFELKKMEHRSQDDLETVGTAKKAEAEFRSYFKHLCSEGVPFGCNHLGALELALGDFKAAEDYFRKAMLKGYHNAFENYVDEVARGVSPFKEANTSAYFGRLDSDSREFREASAKLASPKALRKLADWATQVTTPRLRPTPEKEFAIYEQAEKYASLVIIEEQRLLAKQLMQKLQVAQADLISKQENLLKDIVQLYDEVNRSSPSLSVQKVIQLSKSAEGKLGQIVWQKSKHEAQELVQSILKIKNEREVAQMRIEDEDRKRRLAELMATPIALAPAMEAKFRPISESNVTSDSIEIETLLDDKNLGDRKREKERKKLEKKEKAASNASLVGSRSSPGRLSASPEEHARSSSMSPPARVGSGSPKPDRVLASKDFSDMVQLLTTRPTAADLILRKKILKTLELILENPDQNSLDTKKLKVSIKHDGIEVPIFQSRVEHDTHGARRIYWVRGANGVVTVLEVRLHPEEGELTNDYFKRFFNKEMKVLPEGFFVIDSP